MIEQEERKGRGEWHDMKERPLTNQEFLLYVMNHCTVGDAFGEAFVMAALEFYTTKVTENGKPEEDNTAVINPIAWFYTGMYMKRMLDEHYQRSVSDDD